MARRLPGFTAGARAWQAADAEVEPASQSLAAGAAAPIAAAPAVRPTALPAYHGGPLIQNVEACAVFIGAGWSQAPASQVAQAIENFVSFFVTSELLARLAVFGAGGFTIGHGTTHPAVHLPGTPVAATIQDAQLRDFLTAGIASGDLPATTPDSLYILCMPDGVVVNHPELGDSCARYCGYHSNASGTPYVVMPFLACNFCLPENTSTADAMTAVLSHEMCEAITNPLGNAWFADDDAQDEIGDLCNNNGWSTRRVGGFLVQQFCLPNGVCF